jgi:hypothetical protein
MPLIAAGPTIAAGESLSNACDIGSNQPFMIITPPEWDYANLTFEVSVSTTPFYVLHFGGKLAEIACVPNAAVMLNVATFWPRGLKVKFRSGTPDNPIIQTQQRMFQLLTG